MKFRNGTNDDEFRTLKMWGSESVTLESLKNKLFVRSKLTSPYFIQLMAVHRT